jgi:hypothetical protein
MPFGAGVDGASGTQGAARTICDGASASESAVRAIREGGLVTASSRRGVYLAYVYYKKLFSKIRRTPVERVAKTRIRVANYEKMGLLCGSLLRHQFGVL